MVHKRKYHVHVYSYIQDHEFIDTMILHLSSLMGVFGRIGRIILQERIKRDSFNGVCTSMANYMRTLGLARMRTCLVVVVDLLTFRWGSRGHGRRGALRRFQWKRVRSSETDRGTPGRGERSAFYLMRNSTYAVRKLLQLLTLHISLYTCTCIY